MPGKQLSAVEIGQINGYKNCGKSAKEIGRIMGRSAKTISRFMKKWEACGPGESPCHKKKLGGKGK